MAKKDEPEVEEMVVPGRWTTLAPGKVTWEPGYSSEVCPLHEVHLIHRTATGWTCEHKTVQFQNPDAIKPADATEVQAVSPGDLRQQAAAILAQAEAMEAANGGS